MNELYHPATQLTHETRQNTEISGNWGRGLGLGCVTCVINCAMCMAVCVWRVTGPVRTADLPLARAIRITSQRVETGSHSTVAQHWGAASQQPCSQALQQTLLLAVSLVPSLPRNAIMLSPHLHNFNVCDPECGSLGTRLACSTNIHTASDNSCGMRAGNEAGQDEYKANLFISCTQHILSDQNPGSGFQRVRSDRTWSCKCSSTQPPSLMFLMSSSAALCPVFSAGSPACRCQSHDIRPITFEVLQVHFKCTLLSIAGHLKSELSNHISTRIISKFSKMTCNLFTIDWEIFTGFSQKFPDLWYYNITCIHSQYK